MIAQARARRRTLDAEQVGVDEEGAALVKDGALPRGIVRLLLEFALGGQTPAKFHVVQVVDGRAGLLHRLDGGEGFVVDAVQLAGEKGEDSDLAVGSERGRRKVLSVGRKGERGRQRLGLCAIRLGGPSRLSAHAPF
jgi:hypothetical protein